MRLFSRRRIAEPLPPAPRAVDIIRQLDDSLCEVRDLVGALRTVISMEKGHPVARER